MSIFCEGTNNIKSKIPHGGISEIARTSGKSRYTVQKVIDGKSNNKSVLEALAKYVSEVATAKNIISSNINML